MEPKTVEEAEERRLKLGKTIHDIQMKLTEVNGLMSRRLSDVEFGRLTQERRILCQEKTKLEAERSIVLRWLKSNNKNIARTIHADAEEIDRIPSNLVYFAHASRDLIQALKLRIEELLTENELLHRRLQQYEIQNTNVAPDYSREEWRHGDNVESEVKL